jgi:hypothetical protein
MNLLRFYVPSSFYFSFYFALRLTAEHLSGFIQSAESQKINKARSSSFYGPQGGDFMT